MLFDWLYNLPHNQQKRQEQHQSMVNYDEFRALVPKDEALEELKRKNKDNKK